MKGKINVHIKCMDGTTYDGEFQNGTYEGKGKHFRPGQGIKDG